jgi:hypothetical protein
MDYRKTVKEVIEMRKTCIVCNQIVCESYDVCPIRITWKTNAYELLELLDNVET